MLNIFILQRALDKYDVIASNSTSVVQSGAGGQSCASLSQLTFTEIIRRVDEVQFMFDVSTFEDLSKPLTLNAGVSRKVE
jgi:hypothetical protein